MSQLAALAGAVSRELSWGLRAVKREIGGWRAKACEIPEPAIRADALSALDDKRGHIDGAALFSIVPNARNGPLLRFLVAYEVIWDYLDSVNERAAQVGQANGRQLHLALIDALDPARPLSDYYRYHPWKDDGGYLRSLVGVCRRSCPLLPSYERVRSALIDEARDAQVLAVNHEPDAELRDRQLRAWATEHARLDTDLSWYERTGGASASMTVHALLTLAAEPSLSDDEIANTRRTYRRWVSTTTTMLDSYVDQIEDRANDDHSYVMHYPTPEVAARRIAELVRLSLIAAGRLPRGERHTVIVSCMVAMYLSKDSARTSTMAATTRCLVGAGGSLTRLLLPILRLWRVLYAQRSN